MLTLYFAPGACSMAAHIVLEESGETYQPQQVDLAKGEQRTEAYLKIHPQGRVPALRLDNGEPLTENTAILPYLGKRFGLWPSEPAGDAKALSLIGFFAASVHPAHAHVSRPERYAADPAVFPTIKETGLKTYHGYLKQIDGMLAGREWFSDRYSPTVSSSTPGACAASCRWASWRTTPRSRTACSSAPPSSAWWSRKRSRSERRGGRSVGWAKARNAPCPRRT
jgi:glutathione S-transferase